MPQTSPQQVLVVPPTSQPNTASTEPSLPTITPPAQPTISTQASVIPNVFHSQSDFVVYLKEHPKCKEYVQQLTAGTYSIQGRRAVTQVAVSKLIDTYGYYLDTKLKEKVAGWLADITKMNFTDYFDAKTHKGFLSKDLENRRRHLLPSEKRWVWNKKAKCNDDESCSSVTPLLDSSASADNLDGCPRNGTECVNCRGK